MARLDIAEKRLPQDGRIEIRFDDRGEPKELDVRVSVPADAVWREDRAAAPRLCSELRLEMSGLGFEAEPLGHAGGGDSLCTTWGMVLVTGPTGSGKTSTLYSCIPPG